MAVKTAAPGRQGGRRGRASTCGTRPWTSPFQVPGLDSRNPGRTSGTRRPFGNLAAVAPLGRVERVPPNDVLTNDERGRIQELDSGRDGVGVGLVVLQQRVRHPGARLRNVLGGNVDAVDRCGGAQQFVLVLLLRHASDLRDQPQLATQDLNKEVTRAASRLEELHVELMKGVADLVENGVDFALVGEHLGEVADGVNELIGNLLEPDANVEPQEEMESVGSSHHTRNVCC